jgi:hypothetical protein
LYSGINGLFEPLPRSDLWVKNDLEDSNVHLVTEEDLKELGIKSLGHRKLIAKFIQDLKGSQSGFIANSILREGETEGVSASEEGGRVAEEPG